MKKRNSTHDNLFSFKHFQKLLRMYRVEQQVAAVHFERERERERDKGNSETFSRLKTLPAARTKNRRMVGPSANYELKSIRV
jgi:hypothetical protein